MTSQNNTLRCAASTMYSMAGANTSGVVNAPIEDGSAWLDGIVCSLLVPQPARRAQRPSPRAGSCATASETPLSESDGLLYQDARVNGMALRARKPFTSPRPIRLDLYQVPGKARRIVRPYRRALPGPQPKRFSPTSASCRHLRATLRDTRRFRP